VTKDGLPHVFAVNARGTPHSKVWLALKDDPAAAVTGEYFCHPRLRTPNLLLATCDTEWQKGRSRSAMSLRAAPASELK
jgi:hypothetical protein